MENEVWQPIPSFPGFWASSLGQIKSEHKIHSQNIHIKGKPYLTVAIAGTKRLVHQLVCEAFHGPKPSPQHEVAHGKTGGWSNRPENLRWATRLENNLDKLLHTKAKGKTLAEIFIEVIAEHREDSWFKAQAAYYGVCKETLKRMAYRRDYYAFAEEYIKQHGTKAYEIV